MAHVDRSDGDHPNRLLRFLRASRKYSFLVREADHVVTSSPALNERCLAINRRRRLHLHLVIGRHRPVPAGQSLYERGACDDRLDRDFQLAQVSRPAAAACFKSSREERPFRLRVIGNFDYALPGVDLEVLRWTAEREVEQLQGIDIGVYPLPVDDGSAARAGSRRSNIWRWACRASRPMSERRRSSSATAKRAAGQDRRGMAERADALAR